MSFNDLSYSLIADDLGAAFGFRSDSVFEILQDSNKNTRRDFARKGKVLQMTKCPERLGMEVIM